LRALTTKTHGPQSAIQIAQFDCAKDCKTLGAERQLLLKTTIFPTPIVIFDSSGSS